MQKSIIERGSCPRGAVRTALALLLALTAALPATAQWKWRDPSGRFQYSDRPPPVSVAEKDILQRPIATAARAPMTAPTAAPAVAASAAPALAAAASATGASASAPARSDPALEAKRREAERAEAAKQKAEGEKLALARADNCQRARAQLRTLDDGMRIARVNAAGEREILDDGTRAAEAARARGVIASDCR